MRTATTTIEKHDGAWETAFYPPAPIWEQKEFFRKHLGVREHPTIASIHYQESDQPKQIHRMRKSEMKAETSKQETKTKKK